MNRLNQIQHGRKNVVGKQKVSSKYFQLAVSTISIKWIV